MTFEDIISTSHLKRLFYSHLHSSGVRGNDSVLPTAFESRLEEEINIIQTKTRIQTYTFTYYREKLISKGAKHFPRVLSIPTVRDRLLLLALKEYLHLIFPECINRDLPNKKIADLYKYMQQHSDSAYLKTDIKGFYDHIDHTILFGLLKEKIEDERILSLLWKAIHNPTVPFPCTTQRKQKEKPTIGIPQGLSISNILSEIYMSDFDLMMKNRFPFYSRYVDDMLFFTNGPLKTGRQEIRDNLKRKKLHWNLSKTSSGKKVQEIVYLGYLISPQKITVPEEKVSRFIRRIAGVFTEFKKQYQQPEYCPVHYKNRPEALKASVVADVPPPLPGVKSGKKRYGWICYYSHLTDIILLNRIDHIIISFFRQSEIFDYQKPESLKSVTRAYYELKKGKNSYLYDYDTLNTPEKKRAELIRHNLIREEHSYSPEIIERLYNRFLVRSLYSFEKDSGIINGKNSG